MGQFITPEGNLYSFPDPYSVIISGMKILREPALSREDRCPYLAALTWQQEYFLAADLDDSQFQNLLDRRFRRFGAFFFRPLCPSCRKCRPIRIDAAAFEPGKSQRRVLRKNSDTEVRYRELSPRRELYEIYEKHSRMRFDQQSGEEEFLRNFYTPTVPSFQSEYFIGGKLAGFGILDRSSNGPQFSLLLL